MSYTFGNVASSWFVGVIIGGVAGFVGKCYLDSKSNTSRDSNFSEIMHENEKLKNRIKEMEDQIDCLSVSNQKHRNSEKDSDEEIEDLEEELKSLKQKIKSIQMLNTKYETEIQDYKNTIDSLKLELNSVKGEK